MNANDDVKTNKKVKDSLFRFIFGNDKDAALSLYNAVNNSNYTNSNDLTFTTLEDVVYMKMKNDVSFLFGDMLNLYEHQSTYNPNMPLRGFLYFADLYRKFIKDKDIYGSRLITLPTPGYIVFYNGPDKNVFSEDSKILRLSDAFELKSEDGDNCFEWTTKMLNINYGKNKELMKKCKKLKEYSTFIFKIREYYDTMNYKEAVDAAVDYCIKNNILKDILSKHRAEVQNMLLTEYNEELHIKNERDIAWEEGLEKGREEGREEGLLEGAELKQKEMVKTMLSNGITPEKLAVLLNTNVESILK